MQKSKQLSLIPNSRSKKDHGGSLALGKRRSKRPLNLKQSHHITMKSHHAMGPRSLFKHKKMILSLMKKNSFKFHIKIYDYAIQGNHLHMLVKAQSREGLQNFFRVLAGHVAQKILKDHSLKPKNHLRQNPTAKGGAPRTEGGCQKNQRKFWSYLLFSRIVSWGREFYRVLVYIQKNTLELLQIIAYQPRGRSAKKNSS